MNYGPNQLPYIIDLQVSDTLMNTSGFLLPTFRSIHSSGFCLRSGAGGWSLFPLGYRARLAVSLRFQSLC